MYHKGNRSRLCISQRMNYDEPLMKFWDLSLSAFKLDTEIKARIIGVKVQMEKLKFFYGLSLGQRLFSVTENLSKMLPSKSMSALTGLYFAKLTTKTSSEMQIEESSKLLFDTVEKKSSIYTFESEPGLRRGLVGGAQITNLLLIISK